MPTACPLQEIHIPPELKTSVEMSAVRAIRLTCQHNCSQTLGDHMFSLPRGLSTTSHGHNALPMKFCVERTLTAIFLLLNAERKHSSQGLMK